MWISTSFISLTINKYNISVVYRKEFEQKTLMHSDDGHLTMRVRML
jgi:hypothetical protein